jgi:patatin-like phospholipase/acyl hydrolase
VFVSCFFRKIYQLFDLIVGSGVGGFIALNVALKKDDTNQIAKFLSECTQHRESALLKRSLFLFSRYKFQSKFLENQLERLFSDQKLYKSSLETTTPLVPLNNKKYLSLCQSSFILIQLETNSF